MVTAYGIFSGGLDSLLASRLLLDQGIDVRLITFVTPFFSDRRAQDSSRLIGLATRPVDITRLHLAMLRNPKHGFGRFMNPCIDCHALMFNQAGQIMTAEGGDFLFSGEVLGQRPMSQNIQALGVVARESGFPHRILRPLSALRLLPTPVEEAGLVDRQRLLGFSGRSRKPQMALAASYGLTGYPSPAGGCLLTDPIFSIRLKELRAAGPDLGVHEVELLKWGRHFRLPGGRGKLVVGRKQSENEALERLARPEDVLLTVMDVPGPTALLVGGDEQDLDLAASITVAYSDADPIGSHAVQVLRRNDTILVTVSGGPKERYAEFMIR
jgi:hypothetical protein